MKVRIDVTAEDIANGQCGSPHLCPVAIGIRRAINAKDGYRVAVGCNGVDIGSVYAAIPKPARAFIRAFDDGLIVQPLTFEMNMPDKIARRRGLA